MNQQPSTNSHERLAPQATAVRWRIVVLLMLTTFLCHFNRISMSVAGTEKIMEERGISEVQMGTVYSSYLMLYTLCMIPGGWIIDRFGTKFALLAMGILASICVAATGAVSLVATSSLFLMSLLLVRSLAGMVSVPMHPAAARAVASWLPLESRTWGNGIVVGAALVGVSSTYFLFGALIDRFDWPLAFVISACATLALTIAWALYATSSPAEHRGVNDAELRLITGKVVWASAAVGPTRPWYSLLRDQSLICLTLSYAAVGYFQYLFFYWAQYYFDKVLELGPDRSRLYATWPNVAMAVGMFLGGWASDRLSRRCGLHSGRARVAVSGMLAGTIFLACGVVAHDPRWIVLWFSLAMGAVGMAEGPFWVTAVELGGAQGGAAAAIFNTGGNMGGLLAPVVTPRIAAQFGWHSALPVAGACCLIGAALWWWITPQEQESVSTVSGVVG